MAAFLRRAALALGLAAFAAAPAGAAEPTTILNASYDVGRELYVALNAAFAADWKAKSGAEVTVNQSHAGTSKQARSILEGLDADVVTFNQELDVQFLADKGAVASDWRTRLPNGASPYFSLPAFVVRSGNPKNVKNWDDLVRSDVKVVFPNPKTSGNARYTYLAAYAFALKAYGGDEAKADDFVKKLLANVPVFDTGGRGATTTFVERGIGDVLVTFEAETAAVKKEYGADKVDVVVPPVSLLADFPVSVVDKVVEKRGTRAVATGYLEWLYSPKAQEIIASFNNRPRDAKVTAATAAQFPKVDLLTVDDVFGGWKKANEVHFASGGKLDQLFVGR
ncbi:sulfate transport system substrate-binding protein [Methylopila capsulata]|uniref:Sulfate ABC transporter substrate-binding protein n=1 Tax=Methylopila capsulata TaxID=61654 RepID=A0A9W6MT63_9HYPH|nr:sulfate ABC transporter substrate-binding protein [Methylopila capsulata]MBM7852849.1 sulfate transport system substrate-binding protein [Methylopila capsulata]GLK57058.1 sulfate ABC transporter substrate-binding protein [Methylopila capsulata]